MSYDLKTLAQHREALLLAEVAAWLHNIGKLDPNFIGGAPKELSIEGYRFQRFAAPDLTQIPNSKLQALLQQELDKEEFERQIQTWIQQRGVPQTLNKALTTLYEFTRRQGPLCLVAQEKREHVLDQQKSQQIKQYVEVQIQKKVEQWKKQYPHGWEHLVSRKRDEYTQQREEDLKQALEQIHQNEKREERTREQKWRSLKLTVPGSQESWALADLLTLFWDAFFEKPNIKHQYDPGSEKDPDYQRVYLLQHVLPDLGPLIPALLILAHGEVSGQEKAGYTIDGCYCERDECENNDRAENLQKYSLADLRLSTAFGYESTILDWPDWPQKRRHIVEAVPDVWRDPLAERANFKELIEALRGGISDARLPFNEISLLDYVEPIAAFFKTALAQAILTERIPTPADMHWRLSSVRVNAFDFLFQANQLSDLLARKQLLNDAQGIIRHVLEVELPVGADVYADEHGSVFLIPELPELDKGQIERELRSLLHNALANPQTLETLQEQPELYGAPDIHPTVNVGSPQRGKKLNLPEVLPEKEPINTHDSAIVRSYWVNQKQDLCTACRLRPIGYVEPGLPHFVTQEKADERNLCGVCLARRGRRAQIWAENKGQETIWIDEIADTNGRIALIVGEFELKDWLNGTLVRSLAVGTDENGTWLAKPPTFARIQRVWRTTHQFWQEIQQCFKKELTDDRRRLLLWLDQTPDLGRYHTYELEVGATTLSLAWHPPSDGQTGYFISADNLGYTARQLGAEKKIYTSPAAAAIYVEDYLQEHFVAGDQSPVLHNPEATGARRKNLIAGHSIVRLEYQEAKYATAIPILTEPRTFMALVPANRALDVIQAIKQKYEREMGKVRNRLPLHLGVVYFHRRTPLRAALDADQRMLEQRQGSRGVEGRASLWRVAQDVEEKSDSLPDHLNYLAEDTQQFEGWYPIKLQQKTQEITWHVPAVMGDGETKDVWYPYVFLETDHEPLDHDRHFQAPNPWSGDDGWLVHAGDLKQDDVVYFTPATFDFEHLDTTARRFEVSYAHGRRRGADKAQRLYLLDDLARIEDVWQTLRDGLSTSQIKALETLIETKRRDWEKPKGAQALALPDDDPFRQICRDALANAEWRGTTWQNIPKVKREQLVRAAVSGVLADAIELHLTIAKEEIDPKHKETI